MTGGATPSAPSTRTFKGVGARRRSPSPPAVPADDRRHDSGRLGALLGAHQRLALISTGAGLLGSVAGAFPRADSRTSTSTSRRGPADDHPGPQGRRLRPRATVDDALLTVVLTIQPTVVGSTRPAPGSAGAGSSPASCRRFPRSLVGTRSCSDADCQGRRRTATGQAPRLRGPAHGAPDGRAAASTPRPWRSSSPWCDALEADLAPVVPWTSCTTQRRRSLVDVASRRAAQAGRRPGSPTIGVEVMRRGAQGGVATGGTPSPWRRDWRRRTGARRRRRPGPPPMGPPAPREWNGFHAERSTPVCGGSCARQADPGLPGTSATAAGCGS